MKYLLLFVLLLAIVVVSSNQGSETTLNGGKNVGIWTVPGLGTEYIYQYKPNDSTVMGFDTFTVLKTGQHISGKTNVVVYTVSFAGRVDTDVYNIESNGDFSFGVGQHAVDSLGNILPNIIYAWQTFPAGSRNTLIAQPPVDSFDAAGDHYVSSNERTFVDSENLTLPSGQFSTLHVRGTQIDDETSVTNRLSTYTDTAFVDIWFVPSIGLYTKWNQTEVESGKTVPEANNELIKYLPR